jgi:hypothetical protein
MQIDEKFVLYLYKTEQISKTEHYFLNPNKLCYNVTTSTVNNAT